MTTTMKRFYFSNQQGVVIDDDLSIETALMVINELRRQGFYYCRSLWLS